jgi:hypothetical protein
MKKLILLVVVFGLIVAYCDVASASIITGVDRSKGRSANKQPIGVYTGETDPITVPLIMLDGNIVFSDRMYPWNLTPAGMIGMEYIPTFNDDKNASEVDVSYKVTIGKDAQLWMAVDNRLADEDGTGPGVLDDALLLAWVELTTYRLPSSVQWADSGMDVYIAENATTNRPMSVLMTTTALSAGTYDFGLMPSGNNFYVIGAVPEPATIALLGLGGLGLLRRKR